MPICILVSFEKYTGPVLYENSIPIVPVVASFKNNEISCTCKQLPLMLAYAVSIRRSQGITLAKAIVNLEDNEFQVGLTYVPLSRVKILEGLGSRSIPQRYRGAIGTGPGGSDDGFQKDQRTTEDQRCTRTQDS